MNIVQSTFHGVRIKVTYKCGHVESELSHGPLDEKARHNLAKKIVCNACMFTLRRITPTALRPVADPISVRNNIIFEQNKDKLLSRFSSLRTR